MPTVFIPTMLRPLSRGDARVEVVGATLAEVVDALDRRYPGFRDAILEDGDLRPGLAASIDSEIATLGLMEPVGAASEVHFLPAIGGGT